MKRIIAGLLSCAILTAGCISASAADLPEKESGVVSYTHQEGKTLTVPMKIDEDAYKGLVISIKSSKKVVGMLVSISGNNTGLVYDSTNSKSLIKKEKKDDFPAVTFTDNCFSVLNSQEGTAYTEETKLAELAIYCWAVLSEDGGEVTLQVIEIYDENLEELSPSDYELKYEILDELSSDTDTDSDSEEDTDTAAASDTDTASASTDSDTENNHEHVPVDDPPLAATCTTPGHTRGSHCKICGKVLEPTQEIPCIPHTIVNLPAEEATCSSAGLTEGSYCSVCHTVFKEQKVISALPHTLVDDPPVAATCEHTGLTKGWHCKVCGTVIEEQEVIPKTPHEFVDGVCIHCGTAESAVTDDTESDLPSDTDEATDSDTATDTEPAASDDDTDTSEPPKPGDTDSEKPKPDDPPAPPALPGDVDKDGYLTANDALLILRCSLDLEQFDKQTGQIADFDEDRYITANDALLVLRKSLGM